MQLWGEIKRNVGKSNFFFYAGPVQIWGSCVVGFVNTMRQMEEMRCVRMNIAQVAPPQPIPQLMSKTAPFTWLAQYATMGRDVRILRFSIFCLPSQPEKRAFRTLGKRSANASTHRIKVSE